MTLRYEELPAEDAMPEPDDALLAAGNRALGEQLRDALALVDILKRNLANKEHEIEHLSARLDECLYADKPALNTGGEVIGYYVIVEKRMAPDETTIDSARERATILVREGGAATCDVIEARKVGTVVRLAEWMPA
jgi:hypothetical protein